VNPAGCHGGSFWRIISAGHSSGSFWRVLMASKKSRFLKKRKAKEKEENVHSVDL
jgi:hypothetical protein